MPWTVSQVKPSGGCAEESDVSWLAFEHALKWYWLGVLALGVAFPLVVVIHEACHVAGAWLVGLHPRKVRIGQEGPTALRFHIGKVEWRIQQRVWGGGDTLAIARKGLSRWPWVTLAAAGPLGGALVGLGLWWATTNPIVRAFALANVIYSGTNCFGSRSDGASVIRRLRGRVPTVAVGASAASQ